MTQRLNEFGQPIGAALAGWTPRALPGDAPMIGTYCRLERIDPARHAEDLFAAFDEAGDWRDWTYLPLEPFSNLADFSRHFEREAASRDPLHFAIIDRESEKPVGSAAYLRIDAASGVMEVGAVRYTRRLMRTRAGTEAMYLMMTRAFDELGYRRYEWKCDALNFASYRAAERYGFQFEGIFRQAVVVKGRNRDTAWFSILDREWPKVRAGFETWLSPDNFDADGHQRKSLAALR